MRVEKEPSIGHYTTIFILVLTVGIYFLYSRNKEEQPEEPPTPTHRQHKPRSRKPARTQPEGDKIFWHFKRGYGIIYDYTGVLNATLSLEGNPSEDEYSDRECTVTSNGDFYFNPVNDGSAKLGISIFSRQSEDDTMDCSQFFSAGSSKLQSSFKRIETNVTFQPDGTLHSYGRQNKNELIATQLMLDLLFQMPPDIYVEPGDSWETSLDYLSKGSDSFEGTIQTTFVDWERTGRSKLARFEYTVEISEAGEDQAKMNMEIEGNGTWIFNPALGRLVSSSLEYSIDSKSISDDDNGYDIYFHGEGTAELNSGLP